MGLWAIVTCSVATPNMSGAFPFLRLFTYLHISSTVTYDKVCHEVCHEGLEKVHAVQVLLILYVICYIILRSCYLFSK